MPLRSHWIRLVGAALILAALVLLAVAALLRPRDPEPGAPSSAADAGASIDPALQIGSTRIAATRTRVREPDSTPVGRLVEAARSGDVRGVEDLVQQGVDVGASDLNGDLPLCQAARAGSIEVVDRLVAAGADPNMPDGVGWFPLSYAILAGSPAVTKRLLDAGAEVRPQMPGGSPLEPLVSGWIAAEGGIPGAPPKRDAERVEVARLLLPLAGAAGAASVLQSAVVVMKNEELVEVLLEHGVRLDASTRIGRALLRLRGPMGDLLRAAAERDTASESGVR